MREYRTSGSVRGVPSNGHPYRNPTGAPPAAPGQPSSQPAPLAPPPPARPGLANSNALPVYLSTTAFQPTLGNATYQKITLPAGEPPIDDPPPEIYRIALPPAGRKA
jgi:hypothetical protein